MVINIHCSSHDALMIPSHASDVKILVGVTRTWNQEGVRNRGTHHLFSGIGGFLPGFPFLNCARSFSLCVPNSRDLPTVAPFFVAHRNSFSPPESSPCRNSLQSATSPNKSRSYPFRARHKVGSLHYPIDAVHKKGPAPPPRYYPFHAVHKTGNLSYHFMPGIECGNRRTHHLFLGIGGFLPGFPFLKLRPVLFSMRAKFS